MAFTAQLASAPRSKAPSPPPKDDLRRQVQYMSPRQAAAMLRTAKPRKADINACAGPRAKGALIASLAELDLRGRGHNTKQ